MLSLVYPETVKHMLLEDDQTRGVWFTVGTFDDWLLKTFSSLQGNEEVVERIKATIAFIYWEIWKERCAAIFSQKHLQVDAVISRINMLFMSFLDYTILI